MKKLISNVIDTLMDGDDPNRSLLGSITVREIELLSAALQEDDPSSDVA